MKQHKWQPKTMTKGDTILGFKAGKCKAYHVWYHMMSRCYNEERRHVTIAYIGCTVDKTWHNYQVFAAWYTQYALLDEKDCFLDKDLLIPGNKRYAADSCLLVPRKVNNFFVVRKNKLSILPLGVKQNGSDYLTCCNTIAGKRINKGFRDLNEAANYYWRLKEIELIKLCVLYPRYAEVLRDYFTYFKLTKG